MKKTRAITVFLIFILAFSIAFAAQTIIEAEGYSVMGDGPEESPAVAKERARQSARRAAAEKAGVYIEAFSKSQNGVLTKDEVKTFSSTVLEVKSDEVTSETIAGIAVKYTCKLVAVVDTAEVEAQMNKDREKIEDAVLTNKDQEIYQEQNDKEFEELKERYKTADDAEKVQINEEIKRNEEKFTASRLQEKAASLYAKNEVKEAEETYKQAIETDDKYAAPWSGLGQIAKDRGDMDKAIEYFENAISRYSEFAVSWNGLAYANNYKGNYEEAIKYCKKAIELEEKYAAPWNNLGYAYDALKDYAKALECYQKAAELDPKDPAPW